MARLIHRDGYTLDASFPAQSGIPKVEFKYRYADPESVFEYQTRIGRAFSGAEHMLAACQLLFPKDGQPLILDWDIDMEAPNGSWVKAERKEEILRQLPVPVINHLCNVVCRYTAGQSEADVKN